MMVINVQRLPCKPAAAPVGPAGPEGPVAPVAPAKNCSDVTASRAHEKKITSAATNI